MPARLRPLKGTVAEKKTPFDEAACINIMTAVMGVMIKDYLIGISRGGHKKQVAAGRIAEEWIFNDNYCPRGYVFSFNSICKVIDLEPQKFRAKLRKIKTPADVDEVWHRQKLL